MTESVFDMHVSLIIETSKEIQTITDFLGVEPTDFLKKGQSHSKVVEKAQENRWIFTQKHRGLKEIGSFITRFFNEIPDFSKKISDLKSETKAVIRLSVISDYAQLGFCLSPRDIELLNSTKIPFEISIFSWGKCDT